MRQKTPDWSYASQTLSGVLCCLPTWYSSSSWVYVPAAGDRLFLAGKFLPDYVEAVLASRRLPPKAAVIFSVWSSFLRRVQKSGGPEFLQSRRSTLKIHYERTKLPALQRFFSFPVWRGRLNTYLFCLRLNQPFCISSK